MAAQLRQLRLHCIETGRFSLVCSDPNVSPLQRLLILNSKAVRIASDAALPWHRPLADGPSWTGGSSAGSRCHINAVYIESMGSWNLGFAVWCFSVLPCSNDPMAVHSTRFGRFISNWILLRTP